jgi:methyltransferase-like protein/SAM-dependent methyltransferase
MVMAEQTAPFAYDEVPYPSWSFNHAHPNAMASVALLLGLHPPLVERCRVLELGCSAGGNLMSMAYSIPQGTFLGIDLSAREIAEGQRQIAALGLHNVTLRHMNILEVDDSWGQFDYIVAHGVYSWVPPVVQEKILEICRCNLVPEGVAYISYNTLPGWHMLGTMRDMMCYHARDVADLPTRAAKARELVAFLSEHATREDVHSQFLRAYANYFGAHMVPREDAFLVHDELSDFNEPVYFYQFAERAARHGLQYLGDTNFQSMLTSNLPEDLATTLEHMVASTVELEQYLDFIRNRTFRRSLLCHAEARLSCRLDMERMRRLHFAAPVRPEYANVDVHSGAAERFLGADGMHMAVDHPVTKAALLHLAGIWPRALSFEGLLTAARDRLGQGGGAHTTSTDPASDAEVLAASLLKAYGRSTNLVEVHAYSPPFVLDISERPTASALARFQLRSGPRVTNLRHERIVLEGLTQRLLAYLDGEHDRATLLDVVDGLIRETNGVQSESASTDRADQRCPESRNSGGELDTRLLQLTRAALLVG